MEKEIWKTYPEFDFIEVSNLGRVRTKDRTETRSNGTKLFVKGRVLKQLLYKNGYMYVAFRANGKHIKLRVHRMVATCFIPNPNNYPEVNHKDNDPTNNAVSNLEWCSHEYNIAYREKYGRACNCPVVAIDPENSEVLWFESQMEAARQLCVHQQHISATIKGQRNKTGGYWFTNADLTAVEKTRSKFGDELADKVEKLLREHQ